MKIMQLENLKSLIRDVYDFPTKGIIFRDPHDPAQNGEALQTVNHNLADLYRDKGVTKVVGIESRDSYAGAFSHMSSGVDSSRQENPGNSLPSRSRSLMPRNMAWI